jgi:hypothetical protein
LCTPEKTFWPVTHPEIALCQARLTLEFFVGGLPEKKVYLGGMSILSILLSLESGCHIYGFPLLLWDALMQTGYGDRATEYYSRLYEEHGL